MIRLNLINIFLVFPLLSFTQNAEIFGRISSDSDFLEGVIIDIVNENIQVSTDQYGEYSISIPAEKEVIFQAKMTGFSPKIYFIELEEGERRRLNIQLNVSENLIDEVVIRENKTDNQISSYEIETEFLDLLPAVSGGVETLIKSLPGVSSTNELSSQFSVRGGSYDENVLYINGIEILRPQLIRSGQQEGLSVINSSMTDGIYFSAGGFEPQFGDKLSSVLAIQYDRPNQQRGSAYAGFLGAGLSLENQAKNKQLYYSVGGRYQSNKYLLNSLEENGEYNPVSYDLQAVLGADFSETSNLELLAIRNSTNYDFEPTTTSTTFGTFNNILTFDAYLQGEEQDIFSTNLLGLSWNKELNERTKLTLTGSYQGNDEIEDIGIESVYLLGEQDLQTGQIDTLSRGLQFDYVDNQLKTSLASLSHQGVIESKNQQHYLIWGLAYQYQQFKDHFFEVDSLITILQLDPPVGVVENDRRVNTANSIENHIKNGFIQNTWVPSENKDFSLTGGLRLSHASFTDELLISPRLQASYSPEWKNDVQFKASVGMYQQHPMYREFRNIDGEINENLEAQKSIHAIIGSDYKFFNKEGNPFQFTSEFYYKSYWDLIPYEYDVIRIRYLADNLATGYATGADFRFYGEFVEDAPSWLSLSILKTEEEIEGRGKIRRPTDQRVNASVFWQDYFPNNKNFKANMVGEFGGRLPVGVADGDRMNDTFTIPAYKRLDVGFSANLKGKKAAILPYSPFEHLHSIWLSAEVFNIFNFDNTSSYQWVFTPQGATYAVPNQLTSRRFNAKLTVEF